MQAADFRHSCTLRVRWAEVDMQGVVFNGHYLTYVDVAITEYFRELKLAGGSFSAVRNVLEYKSAARFDDELTLRVRTKRLGRSSFVLDVGIWRGDELLTTCEITYVNTDLATRTSQPLPEDVRRNILAYEPQTPEC